LNICFYSSINFSFLFFNIVNGKNGGRANTNNYINPNQQISNTQEKENMLNNQPIMKKTNQNNNSSKQNINLPPRDPKLNSNAKNSSNKRLNNFDEQDSYKNMRESKYNRDINRSANHAYNDELYKKFDMDSFISPEEEDYIRKQTQKKQEANERCMMLYERAKIKNEVNRINYFKNIEYKENVELSECSFHPQINERNNKQEENLKLIYKNTKIYNRSLQWKENKHNKMEKNKRELLRENEETFQPRVIYLI